MVNNKRKWCCPHCSQTSSRHWNLKKHIERWHHGIGQPIREDKWHSTPSNTTSSLDTMHFIPGMMSPQNNNNYDLNHQRYTQTFSASPYSKKGDDTSKKRDPVEECLEFWRRITQQMKEFQEIKKTIDEFFSSSSSQRSNIITSLGQTSIILPIIPPPVTTTLLQPTPPQPAQSFQEQEQKKKENINPLTTFGANLFNTSTFMAEDPHRRAREVGEGGEDAIIIPQEPSLLPYMRTSTSDNNNNNYSKKRGEPNPITENKEEEQELEEDRHDIEEYHIEEHPSSKSNLLIDNEDDYVINNNIDYDDSSNIDNNYDYSSHVSLVIKRDDHGDIYE
jgi:hypothetical protein